MKFPIRVQKCSFVKYLIKLSIKFRTIMKFFNSRSKITIFVKNLVKFFDKRSKTPLFLDFLELNNDTQKCNLLDKILKY